MTPLEIVTEWARGCSNARPEHPEDCSECTRAMMDALERALEPIPYRITEAGRKALEGKE